MLGASPFTVKKWRCKLLCNAEPESNNFLFLRQRILLPFFNVL